jgi:hypothetical protein
MRRSFCHASIIVCDCLKPEFGEALVAALRRIEFTNAVSLTSKEELERFARLGADVIFVNPHCHEQSEEEFLNGFKERCRGHVQLVFISDEAARPGGPPRISRTRALHPVPLGKLMAQLQPEWERHQPKRMGGPNDDAIEELKRR